MNKALIVFGTRYGAAASTSEEIAKTLLQKGIEVDLRPPLCKHWFRRKTKLNGR